MIDPIKCLLPVPSEPFIERSPKWLTIVPDLFFLNDRLAITLAPVRYRNRKGYIRYVPPGLPHDGASYPWPASAIWDRWDIKSRQVVILHDLTYACHDFVRGWPIGRQEADFDLLDGWRLSDPDGARTRYVFVKLGGEAVWRNKPKDELMESWLAAVAVGKDVLATWIEKVKRRNGLTGAPANGK